MEWYYDFESGSTDDWRFVHEAVDGRVRVVEEPVREGRYAVALTGDAADEGPGEPVRAQLDGPLLFQEGDDAFIGWSTYFPKDIPDVVDDDWFVFFQFHGEPFGMSPPVSFDRSNEDGRQVIDLARGERYGFDNPWSMPLQTDRWIDFVVHIGFSRDQSVGFIELWVDGRPQSFADGSTRLASATLNPEQEDGLFPIATNYYKEDTIQGPVTVFHDGIRVADSYEGAAPRS